MNGRIDEMTVKSTSQSTLEKNKERANKEYDKRK